MAITRPARAQNMPDKLVYIGDNQGGWKRTLTEEVAPAFEKATGIKVEFTLLPPDAWQARMKAEFGAGSSGIDIAQWSVGMAGWISPHMLDHEKVLATIAARDPGFDWNDFLAGSKLAASYDGKLSGIPYRVTTGILVYQKALLSKAGFAEAPGTFAAFEKTALAVNTPPDRYAVGLMGKQGPGLYSSLASWLYSAGGRLANFKTGEIFINDDKAVTALQFMADLVVKDKVTPPEVTTWEFDEIIAGGQRDRYVMAQTFAPYMTLINSSGASKTAGNWAADGGARDRDRCPDTGPSGVEHAGADAAHRHIANPAGPKDCQASARRGGRRLAAHAAPGRRRPRLRRRQFRRPALSEHVGQCFGCLHDAFCHCLQVSKREETVRVTFLFVVRALTSTGCDRQRRRVTICKADFLPRRPAA